MRTALALSATLACLAGCTQPRRGSTPSEIFDLRSKCQTLAEELEREQGKSYGGVIIPAGGRSHYDVSTNRCYVEITRLDRPPEADTSLYDGQTKELLIGIRYASGRLAWGYIYAQQWTALAHFLNDPEIEARMSQHEKSSSLGAPESDATLADLLVGRLMRDERTRQ